MVPVDANFGLLVWAAALATTTLPGLAAAVAELDAALAPFPADALAEAAALLVATVALEELDALVLPLSFVVVEAFVDGVVAVAVTVGSLFTPSEVEGPALALPEPELAAAAPPTAAALELEELEELPAKAGLIINNDNAKPIKIFFILFPFLIYTILLQNANLKTQNLNFGV